MNNACAVDSKKPAATSNALCENEVMVLANKIKEMNIRRYLGRKQIA